MTWLKSAAKLPPATEIVQATFRDVPRGLVSGRDWYMQGLQFERNLAAHGELFAQDVPMNLCFASARRQLGKIEESKSWFMNYINRTRIPSGSPTPLPGADPWRDCVMLESWLMNRAASPVAPKPVALCRKIGSRPVLDGKLDEELWQLTTPLSLSTVAGDLATGFGCKEAIERQHREKANSNAKELDQSLAEGTRAMFAYDDEFLYIGVVCRHPTGLKKDKVTIRKHDMDLRAFDRVSVLIDLDRDYQTYYQLQIDQRGAVADDCWGDSTWNPKWFVAVEPNETGWTAELAIPLKELTGDAITSGKLWAINVVRTVPGKGVQAWSGPAGATPRPEGMGIMTFAENGK